MFWCSEGQTVVIHPLIPQYCLHFPSEELVQKLDTKVLTIKEEIEGIIEELKNDVDVKANMIEDNRKDQTQGFEDLNESLKKLRDEFKKEGKCSIQIWLATE